MVSGLPQQRGEAALVEECDDRVERGHRREQHERGEERAEEPVEVRLRVEAVHVEERGVEGDPRLQRVGEVDERRRPLDIDLRRQEGDDLQVGDDERAGAAEARQRREHVPQVAQREALHQLLADVVRALAEPLLRARRPRERRHGGARGRVAQRAAGRLHPYRQLALPLLLHRVVERVVVVHQVVRLAQHAEEHGDEQRARDARAGEVQRPIERLGVPVDLRPGEAAGGVPLREAGAGVARHAVRSHPRVEGLVVPRLAAAADRAGVPLHALRVEAGAVGGTEAAVDRQPLSGPHG